MKMKTIYTRIRINQQLENIYDYPLTCVIAGAGYGKTTVARDFLKRLKKPYGWLTLTDGNTDVFWDKLCDTVELENHVVSDALHVIGLPTNAWMISRVIKLVQNNCNHPYILCIDDYQFLSDNSSIHSIIETLAFESIPNLHILLLSRTQPNIRLYTLTSKNQAFCIDADTLAFDVKETNGYLAMRGLRLTKDAVANIHECTGGWISAIYLLGEGIRSGGTLGLCKEISALFEENLLRYLPAIDREMLYRISAFPSFPLELAVTALGMERIKLLIENLMRENAFITKDENGEYRFHPLLKEYLISYCPHDEQQKEVYRRASLWYAAREDRKFFYSVELVKKADCVEEFLAFFNKPNANRLNYYDMNAICSMTMNLPQDMCVKYPFPYLQICFYLLLSGEKRFRTFAAKLLIIMKTYFSTHKTEYSNIILGELLVISRVTGFGEIDGDGEPLEEAARLLGGRQSEIVNPSDPFTFGLPMLLHSEFMKAGTLNETVSRCQYNPYELVSDGFGRGSEPLIRAEASLLQCNFNDAKRYAIQAIQEANEKKQYFILASAYCTILRRALFLGDIETATKQLENQRELIMMAAQDLPDKRLTVRMLREVLTLSKSFYDTSLLNLSEIPPDFLDGTHKNLMAGGLGVPQIYEARAMYATGNPMSAMRLCERMRSLPSICQGARLYGLILTALCEKELSGIDSAVHILITALIEAEKDGIILPFAENPNVYDLLQHIKSQNTINPTFLDKVVKLCIEYKNIAPCATDNEVVSLSNRELEVLRLSAKGKTRKKIAEILGVHEETIKKHLATIYKKLNVNGKTEAAIKARTLNIL